MISEEVQQVGQREDVDSSAEQHQHLPMSMSPVWTSQHFQANTRVAHLSKAALPSAIKDTTNTPGGDSRCAALARSAWMKLWREETSKHHPLASFSDTAPNKGEHQAAPSSA